MAIIAQHAVQLELMGQNVELYPSSLLSDGCHCRPVTIRCTFVQLYYSHQLIRHIAACLAGVCACVCGEGGSAEDLWLERSPSLHSVLRLARPAKGLQSGRQERKGPEEPWSGDQANKENLNTCLHV